MTPMIDIVFQLLVFFLLTLKFKTIDERIDSMLPRDRGQLVVPVHPPEFLKIKVKVFRHGLETPAFRDDDLTRLRVDGTAEFDLPPIAQGREARREAVLAGLREVIERKLAAYGGSSNEVKGEIVAPPPTGGAVPHGDVIAVLDQFLAAGVTDVVFEGASGPLGPRDRAARRARE
jgi:hypothetical protein